MQLPERPNLDQLKKQAKELRASRAYRTLAEAQHALAVDYGFASWTRLKRAVDLITLRRAIEDGDADRVRTLVERTRGLASASFDDGRTPLHLAAEENRPAVVEALVQHGGAPASRLGRSSHSALSWAITCWSFDAAEKLVDIGVAPDLFCAAGLGRLDLVQSFWRDGVLTKKPSVTGSSRYSADGERLPSPPVSAAGQVSDALYIACRCNRLDVARWLLDHGADPNWRGFAGATCLAWAEFSGNPALCALLRERGGSDALVDGTFGATPRAFGLMVLAGWGFPRLLFERLSADPSLVTTTAACGTLLHAAADGGQTKCAAILLHFGADARATDAKGRTAAAIASARGHHALAALLQ